jgi:triacylglycerol lipase
MVKKTPKNPVLLVHGIFIQSMVFGTLKRYLIEQGWDVHTLDLSIYHIERGIEHLAEELAEFVERTFPPHQTLDLVGLSMGGLVSRYYVQRLGGLDRIHRFITIASPHQGTWMAYCLPHLTCFQMRPESQFLMELNRDIHLLEKVSFTSIWTPWDFIIVPAESSAVKVGKAVQVPVFAHAMMVRDFRSIQAIVNALNEPVKSYLPLGQTLERQKLPLHGNNI